MSICLLFALHREAAPLLRRLPKRKRIQSAPCAAWQTESLLILETGVGQQRSLSALRWLHENGFALREVIGAGFAGALEAGWQVGDLLLADEIVDGQGRRWPCASRNWNGRRGQLLTMPRMIGDPDEKRQLGMQHHAAAVEMESAAAAEFCQEHGIPFSAIRAISDGVSDRLSPRLVQLLGGANVSIPRLLVALAAKPSLAGELWRLARGTKKAARNLATGLVDVCGL